MKIRAYLSVVIAALVLIACGPSAEDETKMKEKMALEAARAELMLTTPDCGALEISLTAFKSANADELASLDKWWGALGDGVPAPRAGTRDYRCEAPREFR
jgi:hypothetical protein